MKQLWLPTKEGDLLPLLNSFTLKLPGYLVKYGLSVAQGTAARNDYLWLAYAITIANQFADEAKSRVQWKNTLKKGPQGTETSDIPSIGSEFVQPAVPVVLDGILPRFRALVKYIKNHPAYDVADGIDLGIEGAEAPAPVMKPTAALTATGPNTVKINVPRNGHEGVDVYCRRGNEPVATKIGRYTRARFVDDRPNLTPGQPECREYTFQYVDNDQPVGEVSDVFRIVTSGIVAA